MFDLDSARARRRTRGVLRQLTVVLGLLAIAGSARAWDASTPPRFFPSPFDAEFFAGVALQPGDGVVVAGTHGQPEIGDFTWGCKLVVARLARSTGAVDWRTELDDCGDDESHAFAPERSPGAEIVRVDHRGDVLVARSRAGGALAEVVKLDGRSGALLWRRTVARPGVDGRPTTHALALDAAGDVIVGGGDSTNGRRASDLFVAKLDGATGAERWRHELFGPSDDDDARNRADAIAVDSAGDVVVHGQLFDENADGDVVALPLVAKLSGADGRELWRAADGIAPSADVAIDGAGDVVVAGSGAAATLDGSDGTVRWRTDIGRAAPATPEPYAAHVAIGADGSVAVVAEQPGADGTGRDVTVTALDGATGALRWQQVLDSADTDDPVLLTDRAAGVDLDAAGNVVVATTMVDVGAITRPLVVAFARDGGDELWRRAFAGTARARAGAFDLAADGGEVAVAGAVGRSGAFSDGLVALLDGASGDALWIEDESARLPTDRRGVWLDEIAFDAAVDPDGDVIAVGQTWQGVEAIGFAVRKLDGATGTVRWIDEEPRAESLPFNLLDFALAERVATDPSGDVVVLSSRYPTTLVKLDGGDGREAWRSTVTPSPPTQDALERPLAIDAAGEVFVLGDDSRLIDGSFARSMIVKKVSGASGSEVWEAAVPARGSHAIGLDLSGDVLALGQGSVERRETLVVKYDGAGGDELWRHRSTTTLLPDALQVDPAGDALVATRRDLGNGFALGVVVKLDGASGDVRSQSRDLLGATSGLAVDGHGDVLAAGNSSTYAGEGRPLRYEPGAAKLDAATGETLWSRSLDGLGHNVEVVAAIADTNGDLIVAAREVPGRTWLAGMRGSDGALLWTIALGEPGTVFNVRALRLRAPGELVVAGGRAASAEGFAFAVLGLDVPEVVGPPGSSGRTCVVRMPGSLRSTAGATVRCTTLRRDVPTRR